jgi:hypothetical protein
VSLQVGNLVYTPPPSFSGEDSFRITITDVCGANVVGTVSVTVGPPPGIVSLPGGAMQIHFQGIPGRSYPIQRSTDLAAWSVIATVTADQSGLVVFSDESPPLPSAYYRFDVE